ncbi:MAG: glycosyltransferase family 4 protein [Anaerolineae bacterium]|nr:glycosyltransferase family 4 protein [Anaerolineae bacterium]
MKIGLVTYGDLDIIPGEYLYDRMIADRLQDEGNQVDVIILPWQDRYALRLADNLAEETFERLRDIPFDLLLQDERCHPSLFHLNRRLRSHAQYPIIAIVHRLRAGEPGSIWQNRLYGAVERRYLESADGFVFSSQTTQRRVVTMVKDQRPSVLAYPAGDRLEQTITPDKIAARAHETGPLRILFVGNLVPRTGLHLLLDALARLSPSSWHLTIAGSGAADRRYARSIADRLRQNNLLKQVTHVGMLDGARLILRYADSHVLTTPSSYEGSGIPYLEGMSFGLPVIAGTAGAIGEIVTHGLDGFLIPNGNIDALAGYLQSLVDDRDKLLAMSLAARARFDAHPTWSQSTRLIYEFLHNFTKTGLPKS